MRSRLSFGIPTPLSFTLTSMSSPCSPTVIHTWPPGRLYLMALVARLVNSSFICCRFARMHNGFTSTWRNTWQEAASGFRLSMISWRSTLILTSENITSASMDSRRDIIRMSLISPVIPAASFLILFAKSSFMPSSSIMPLSKSSAYPWIEVIGVLSSWDALLKNSWRICFSFSIWLKYSFTSFDIFMMVPAMTLISGYWQLSNCSSV